MQYFHHLKEGIQRLLDSILLQDVSPNKAVLFLRPHNS